METLHCRVLKAFIYVLYIPTHGHGRIPLRWLHWDTPEELQGWENVTQRKLH